MKILSHKTIALIISVVTAVFSSLFFFFLKNVRDEYYVFYVIFFALFLFTIVYVVAFYITREMILQKVKPMYKIIQNAQGIKKNKILNSSMDNNENLNILATTEKDLIEWVKKSALKIEELQKMEKYRKEYIGDVSHELKTPIFSVQGYIETLLDGGIDDPKINIKYLQKADDAIQRMASIVRDLDSITRLESGELKIQKENFNVLELIYDVLENQEYLAQTRKVKLEIDTEKLKKISVYADRKYMTMVFNNLIVNAIKYNKPEGGNVFIRFYDMETIFLVEIADTGIGMEEKELHRIFERFYRVDKSRSREQGGTGLGLSIVKHVIEAHEQTIQVKSAINKGTTFTFTIEKAFENI